MKRLYRNHGSRPYTDYLRSYYCREANPYYEAVEDKWYLLRPLMIEMAELKPGERILDIGTGVGFQAAAFAAEGYRTVGVDLVMDRVRLAKERSGHANPAWMAADAAWLPLLDDSFDVVSVSLALHDLPVPILRACLAEMQRVACRRVVIAEPRLPDQRLLRPVYRAVLALFDESMYLNEYFDVEIECMLETAGLHLVEWRGCFHKTVAIYACEVRNMKRS